MFKIERAVCHSMSSSRSLYKNTGSEHQKLTARVLCFSLTMAQHPMRWLCDLILCAIFSELPDTVPEVLPKPYFAVQQWCPHLWRFRSTTV